MNLNTLFAKVENLLEEQFNKYLVEFPHMIKDNTRVQRFNKEFS